MSDWWFCRMCETANKPTAVICEVCGSRPGTVTTDGALKGDLVRRVEPLAGAAPYRSTVPAPALPHAAPRPASSTVWPPRATWQQRFQTGASRLYERCAEVLRTIARSLS